MRQRTAFLFAGQGAQYVGMGKDLYESFAESRLVFDQADRTLGIFLTQLCFEGPLPELTKTENCQPAILTVSIAAWEAYKGVTKSQSHKVTGYAAGLSLGEYSALVAAGAISFEDAVYLVRQRGKFMEEEAARKPGKMLSVIGLDRDSVKELCRQTNTEIANINCPGQIVISGGVEEVEKARGASKERGAKMAIVLEVSGAFHSSFMKEAAFKLAKELEKIRIKAPNMPVICNVSAEPTSSATEIRANLVKQVASSVLWEDSMKFLLSKGIMNFIEFGPGAVLKGLMRRIDPNTQVITIEKKEDIINLLGNRS